MSQSSNNIEIKKTTHILEKINRLNALIIANKQANLLSVVRQFQFEKKRLMDELKQVFGNDFQIGADFKDYTL